MRLRPATHADSDFCFRLNEATLREYVEPIYGWDHDLQRTYHERWFEPERLSIVEDDDGTAIGVVDVSDADDHLYLSRIEVSPDAQGRGVGTAVMHDLIGRGRTIRLHLFTDNARARRFYERLGFRLDTDLPREHHVSMHRDGGTGDEPASDEGGPNPTRQTEGAVIVPTSPRAKTPRRTR
jgi:RimJ/RimL family protein N-acetyltransferase